MPMLNETWSAVRYEEARVIGPRIAPDLIVLHDTASAIEKGRVAEYLRDNNAHVSVHFVIERDGEIVQQVPTNRRANHAGTSHYHGRQHCNNFSIGIEMVSPGKMRRSRDAAVSWWGERFDIEEYHIEEASTRVHGNGWWMPYTAPQITSLASLLEHLVANHPIRDIVPHWYVSPGRKIDTGPLMPLDTLKAKLFGRDELNEPLADEVGPGEMVWVNTGGDRLNLRRWPSFNNNVIGQIPDGAHLEVLARGNFAARAWVKVLYGNQTGWVVSRLTAEVPA